MTLYDADPFLVFKTTEYADKLKEDFNKNIFQDLVQEYLLTDHGNRVKFIMKPDMDFVKKQVEEEVKTLSKIQLSLTPDQIKNINADCEKLKQRQREHENIDVLPKIELKDISEVRDYPKYKKVTLDNNIPVWQFNAPTNGILHIRIKFNTQYIPSELRVYLPIFTQ